MSALIVLILLAAYLIPTIVASSRSHANTSAIMAVNLLLGWTFLGWVAALVWSLSNSQPPVIVNNAAHPVQEVNAVPKETVVTTGPTMKACPQCGEDVRATALICRFCRFDFTGATLPSTTPT